ncbi:MAG: DMT family transporter [Phycisphaerales bacterium]
MRTALLLTAAIACEVAWAISLKFIKGWHSTGAIMFTAATYIAAVIFLLLAARKLEIGLAYAIWAGTGMALIALIGVFALKESVTPLKVASLALVILGVIGLSLAGVHGK